MVNGLAVLGWGVGGIEAEAAMLGQPYSMLLPEVIGFRLTGKLQGRRDRDRPRAHRHADAAQARRGRQVRRVLRPRPRRSDDRGSRDHRQHGAGIRRDLRLLPDRRRHHRVSDARPARPAARVALVEAYAKAQGMFRTKTTPDPVFTDVLKLDLATVEPSLAGPKRPQDRVALKEVKSELHRRRWTRNSTRAARRQGSSTHPSRRRRRIRKPAARR